MLRQVATPAKSAETLHALMQLRCRQEILERWLASEVLPAGIEQSLRAMLDEVQDRLGTLTAEIGTGEHDTLPSTQSAAAL